MTLGCSNRPPGMTPLLTFANLSESLIAYKHCDDRNIDKEKPARSVCMTILHLSHPAMNSQALKMTDAMWATLPAGGRVAYLAGMTYPADRLPTIIVTSGLYDMTTYTWQTCVACDGDAWCQSNHNTDAFTCGGC